MDIGIGNSLVSGPTRVTPAAVASVPFSRTAAPVATATERAVPAASGVVGVGEQAASTPVEEAVTSIQSFVQSIRRDLAFSLDDSSGKVVVKVTDSASGEVIRQLPSEEALRLAESLEEVRSLLFKAEA